MGISISTDLVKEDGKYSLEATCEAFRSAAIKRLAEVDTEQGEIAQAVTDYFDLNKGKSIPMPTVGSMVAQALNAQPENFEVLKVRVLDYIRANSQERKSVAADGTETVTKHEDSLFVIGKGKGGGCGRRADLTPKLVKPVKKGAKPTPVAAQ